MAILDKLSSLGQGAQNILTKIERLNKTAQVLTIVSKHAKEINQELKELEKNDK